MDFVEFAGLLYPIIAAVPLRASSHARVLWNRAGSHRGRVPWDPVSRVPMTR